MSSYILFSQTTTVTGDRAQWGDGGGAPSAQGTSAPGNPDSTSSFNADTLGPLGAGAKLFDISAGGSGGLGAFGTGNGVANRLFAGNSKTTLSTNNVTDTTIELAQTGANWNGIKNLEIKLDSNSAVTNVDLKNFVDARLQIGDDPCAPLLADAGGDKVYTVDITNVKRGEVDGSLANARMEVVIDVWSNGFGTGHFQNTFDMKGTVYDDLFVVGAGKVTNSQFGNKSGKPGYDSDGTYDGTGTTTFTNMGQGKDSWDSTNSSGDPLSGGKEFKAIDKVWGGTNDDIVSTGGGNDIIFGDNGSGADIYADPGQAVIDVDDNFLVGRLNGGVGDPPGFISGAGGDNLGTSFDAGEYIIIATGGDLMQLRTGPAPHAGGLGIRSADDPPVGPPTGNGDPLGSAEINSRGTDEAITFDFKTGAHEVEIDLNAFWDNEGPAGTLPEIADYTVFLVDGSSFSGSVTAANHVFPASLTLVIGEADTGGILIDKITLSPSLSDGEFSDFFIAGVRACTVVEGVDGNDILIAGTGSDFVQGDGDTGEIHFCGAAGLDVIVNGGFEDLSGGGLVTDHGIFATFTAIPGWSAATDALIEIQIGPTTGGVAPHGGDNKLELDSHPDPALDPTQPTNSTVVQTVDACEGVEYTLSFFFSSRPNDGGDGSSGFEVFWNGVSVFTFGDDPEQVGFVSSGDILVVGGAGDDVLEFRASGLENRLGAFIDDVSLVQNDDFVDIGASGGDQLFLGLGDGAKDTVNYEVAGDGVDIVREFAAGEDVVTVSGAAGTQVVSEVATAEGQSTLITFGNDPAGAILIVGQTGLVVGVDIIFS